MSLSTTKWLLAILAIPLAFRILESVNGPWPIPFKWPEISSNFEDYDTRKRHFIEPEPVNVFKNITWNFTKKIDPENICKFSRNCVPTAVKFPMKIAIAPNVGLSTCIVSGILSAEMEALTCYLERMNVMTNFKYMTPQQIDRYCGATNKFRSILDMSKNIRVRLRDMRKWTFIMLTKDPVERFLHGFIKHCVIQQKGCYGCGNDVECFADAYHMRLLQFAMYNEENYEKISDMDWDLFPQTWMCDVKKWQQKYTLLPFSSNIFDIVTKLTDILGNKYFSKVDRIMRSSGERSLPFNSIYFYELKETIRHSSRLQNLIAIMYHNDFRVLGYDMVL